MTLPDIAVQAVDIATRPGYPTVDHRGRPTPEHDYRLEAATPTGGSITFHRGATAADVAAYWIREGWTA